MRERHHLVKVTVSPLICPGEKDKSVMTWDQRKAHQSEELGAVIVGNQKMTIPFVKVSRQ